MKIIKAGVIGLGFGYLHAQVFKKNKYCDKLLLCDLDKRKKKYSKYLNTKFTNFPKEVLNDKALNFISIATYDNYHAKYILQAIKQKKHIFVEKPFCQNISEFNKIRTSLIKNKNICFMSNLLLRNHPKFLKAYSLIKRGELGKIYHINGEYNYGRLAKINKGWRGKIPFYSVTQGGAIHLIDLIKWFTKSSVLKVISTSNNISTTSSNFKFDDNITTLIKYKNNMTASITSNFGSVTQHDHTMSIYGTKGTIDIRNNNLYFTNSRKKKKIKKFIFKKNPNYKTKLLNQYISSIINKKKLPIKLEETLEVMLVCLKSDLSLKTKKWEKINIK